MDRGAAWFSQEAPALCRRKSGGMPKALVIEEDAGEARWSAVAGARP